jgi:hypothetical protein
MPLMFPVIFFSAICVTRRFAIPISTSARLGMGLLALALMLSAELIMTVVLQNRSLADYIASRDPVSGTVYLVMLVLFVAMPILVGRSIIRRELKLERPSASFHRTCGKGLAEMNFSLESVNHRFITYSDSVPSSLRRRVRQVYLP